MERASRRFFTARWLAVFAAATVALRPSRAAVALVLPVLSAATAAVFGLSARSALHAASLALDDLIAGGGVLPPEAIRHAQRISSRNARFRSAESLRRLVARASDPRARSFEIFDARAVRRHRSELLQLAARFEAGASPRACALLRRLLLQPLESPLYLRLSSADELGQALVTLWAGLHEDDADRGGFDAGPAPAASSNNAA